MTGNGVRAAIYCRISRDSEGSGLGVARQLKACRELAERIGWSVADVYPDNSKSAYDRTKKRPQYERMLADVQAGRVDGVLCYAVDRLTRHPIELERLVEVFAGNRTAVRTVVGGELDLNTEEGLLRARIMGSVARFESGRKGERLRLKAEEMVAAGKRPCGGPRPFGYDRHYDDAGSATRKITGETVNEREAAAIRDAAERLLAGESMRSVSAGWNSEGLLTSLGNRWSITSFRQMMTSPRLAGMVVHRRKAVEGVVAQWPAILEKDTHEELVALLAGRGTPTGSKARKFWLTGSVFCSCGMAMGVGKAKNGKRRYVCKAKTEGGCGSRVVILDDLERFMKALVIKRLGDPRMLRGLAARADGARAETKLLMRTIDQDERRLSLLEAQLADGDPEEIPEVRGALRKVRSRIGDNRASLARLVGVDPVVGLNMDDLDERWESIDVDRKSALLRAANIARIVIRPTKLRGRFDPGRVELVPL
jgi:DNA invertase Pin-like site-specific DNA recombinase